MLSMDRFSLRRAVERLRNGLFDPLAVKRLTMENPRIEKAFSQGLNALTKGEADQLCICGSYGQGKSHTLNHLNQRALAEGYATSVVQLDAREVPFHQFSAVYQMLSEKICLPDGKRFAQAWQNWAGAQAIDSLTLLKSVPHYVAMILTAMLHKDKPLATPQRTLNSVHNYRPREYDRWLEKALLGYKVPTIYLKNIYKSREVVGYKEQSLLCRGNDTYFQMVQSLGMILKEIGYKGLVVFFDEAESISQGRLGQRAKSYHLLDQFFQGKGNVFPIFAFTDDFFAKVNHEDYAEQEIFAKNYAVAWQDLNILQLQDFSSQGWDALLDKLIQLYSEAYQIDLHEQVKLSLHTLLDKVATQETRFKLKALVNKLDIETQQVLLVNA